MIAQTWAGVEADVYILVVPLSSYRWQFKRSSYNDSLLNSVPTVPVD